MSQDASYRANSDFIVFRDDGCVSPGCGLFYEFYVTALMVLSTKPALINRRLTSR